MKIEYRLLIKFNESEYDALNIMADENHRTAGEQASWLVARELEAAGYLVTKDTIPHLAEQAFDNGRDAEKRTGEYGMLEY